MAATQARTKPKAQARAASSKKKTARRTTTKARSASTGLIPKKQKPAKRRASPKRKAVSKTAKTKRAAKTPKSLGRPRLPADAKLDLVFQKDYQAREIFGFLRVTTLKELEQFGPDEIIDRLTAPMVETVQRIRKALALNNRCLKNDRRFALQFQGEWKQGR